MGYANSWPVDGGTPAMTCIALSIEKYSVAEKSNAFSSLLWSSLLRIRVRFNREHHWIWCSGAECFATLRLLHET